MSTLRQQAVTIPAHRQLPSKEQNLFKELLVLYENRQLKKAFKTADAILKRSPQHGETMCMKGLVLVHMGKRDEGIAMVKAGVLKDLTSHIVWHVLGLVHKGEKNYEEALKAFTQALRFDDSNLNLLRDCANLQSQLRLYDALIETRWNIVRIRPKIRAHWVALAVAYHLSGNLAEAKNVMENFIPTITNVPDYDVDHSETLLYYTRLLEDLGLYTESLSILDVNAKERAIVDKTSIMEIRARLLAKLESDEAEHAWQVLVEHNPDSHDYLLAYLSYRKADMPDKAEEAVAILEHLSTEIPRARAPRRLALTYASGHKFKEMASSYVRSALEKGIPSLFVDIKALYSDQSKKQAIYEIVEELRTSVTSEPAGGEPTTYLWTLYFLAQHHSHGSDFAKALETVELALVHTPTLPELYMCKARILKRAGDVYGAARTMDEARLLDGQDRFLNTKSAKYRLRAGLVNEAHEVLGLFTKKDAVSPGSDLEEMQSLLYLVEAADSYCQVGNIAMGLKTYCAIQKVFEEFDDDQYDFHGYSMRKFTLNNYVSLMQWENNVRSHPAYVRAAVSASRILVSLHDDPSLVKTGGGPDRSDGVDKKAKKKAKKVAQQKVQEDVKKGAQPQSSNEDKGIEPPKKEDDPDGMKLLASPNPLELAAKFLAPLSELKDVEVCVAIYDVSVRRKKLLQAAQALHRAKAIDPDHPELHVRIVDLKHTESEVAKSQLEPVVSALKKTVNALFPEELSLELFDQQYLQRHPNDSSAILASAKVSQEYLQTPLEGVENTLFSVFQEGVKFDVKAAYTILQYLTRLKSTRAEEFREKSKTQFPLAKSFEPASEISRLREYALTAVDTLKIGTEAQED